MAWMRANLSGVFCVPAETVPVVLLLTYGTCKLIMEVKYVVFAILTLITLVLIYAEHDARAVRWRCAWLDEISTPDVQTVPALCARTLHRPLWPCPTFSRV